MAVTPRCSVGDPDEDGDGLRDDCDACPAITDAQPDDDTDGDGIGDGCDPHPELPAVCPARRFAGFTSDDGRWIDSSGIQFDGTATLLLPSNTQRILRSKETFGTGRAEIAIADRIFDSQVALAGVVMMATGTTGYFCALHPANNSGTLVLGRLTADREVVEAESQDRFSQTPGLFHRLRLTVTAEGVVSCSSEHGGDGRTYPSMDAMLEFTDDNPTGPGSYGLILQGTTDEVEHLDFIPD